MAGKDTNVKKIDDLNKKELLIFAKDILKKLEETELELKTSKNKINELEEINTKTEEFSKKILKRIKKLERRCDDTEERVYHNETDLNKLNQYSRRENLEIVGIPKHIKHDELENHVIKIFKELGVEC